MASTHVSTPSPDTTPTRRVASPIKPRAALHTPSVRTRPRRLSGSSRANQGLPEALLETVRERARITDLFPPADLQRRGAEFLTLCPWHQDSNASLTVSPRTNRVHCFVCNKGADPIGWLQDRQGVSFRVAVEELARRYAIPLPEQDPEAAAKAEADRQERQRLRQWRSRQEEEFHQALLSDLQVSGTAARYLELRGISPETAIAWRLGLNARRLMLPIRDAMGRCCGFSGRSLNGEEPKYRNSSGDLLFQKSQLLFGLDRATDAIRRSGEALLVEGPLDVIQLHQAGLDNAVASLGAAVTSEQLQRLQRIGTRRLWLAYDGDSAGANASARLIGLARPLLLRGDLDLLVVPFPPGEDPDSLLRGQGVSGLRACLAQGRHWLHWELDRLLADLQNDPDDLSALQRCERQGAELLAQLPPGALRHKAEQRLREALGELPAADNNTAQSGGRRRVTQGEEAERKAKAIDTEAITPQRGKGEAEDQALNDASVQQAERRALRLFLCNPGLREVLSVLELADPLHREAMGWLWCLQQRLAGRESINAVDGSNPTRSGDQAMQGDGLRAAVSAAMPSMDPPLAQLLSPLMHCGETVRFKLAAHPEPELMCILDALEPVG